MTIYRDIAGNRVETVIPMAQPTKEGNFYYKIRSFLDAVKTNGPSPVPTSEILYNQAILSGIFESDRLGHEITLDL